MRNNPRTERFARGLIESAAGVREVEGAADACIPSHENCSPSCIMMRAGRSNLPQAQAALSLEDLKLVEAAEGYYMLNQLSDVLAELDQVSDSGRRHPRYLHAASGALTGLRRFEEALGCVETLIRLHPLHEGARGFKASLLRAMNRDAEAYEILQEAVALFPHNSTHKYDLGCTAAKIGRWDEAKRWIQAGIDTRSLVKTFALANPDLAPIHKEISAMPLRN